MRARKVAILLAITALSALTMFLILLADTDALGAEVDRPEDSVAVPRQEPDNKVDVEDLVGTGDGNFGDLRLSAPVSALFAGSTLSGSLPPVGRGSANFPRKAVNCASF